MLRASAARLGHSKVAARPRSSPLAGRGRRSPESYSPVSSQPFRRPWWWHYGRPVVAARIRHRPDLLKRAATIFRLNYQHALARNQNINDPSSVLPDLSVVDNCCRPHICIVLSNICYLNGPILFASIGSASRYIIGTCVFVTSRSAIFARAGANPTTVISLSG